MSNREQKAIDQRISYAKDLAKKLQKETRCSETIALDLASQIVIGKISLFDAKQQARRSKEDK